MLRVGGGGGNIFRMGIFYRLIENVKQTGSMVRDYWEGKYRRMPCWTFGAILVAILYTLSPLDVIPDYIPGLGQVDDALVIGLCLLLTEKDLIVYRRWKVNHSA